MKALGSAIALAVCFTAFAAIPSRAAMPEAANVRVPFSFIVGDKVLPAGHYTVTAEDSTPSVLFFRSADGLHTALIDTEWGTSGVTEKPTLRFAVYGTTHFLTGVRLVGESLRLVPVTTQDVTTELARLDTEHATRSGE